MSDSTTNQIDSFFDKVDGALDGVRRFLGVDQKDQKTPKSGTPKARPAKRSIPVKSSPPTNALPSSTSTAMSKPRFRLDEVTDAITGEISFIVTDGARSRCEFKDRKTAEMILARLMEAP